MSDLRERTDQSASDTPGVTPEPNGVDYSPRMPDAVRRAAARAEELSAELNSAPAEAPSSTRDSGYVEAAVVGGIPQQDEFVPPPAPEPVAPPPPDEWQTRYQTLQGKYNHEVPQLQAHIRQLENLLATMNSAPARSEPPPMAQIEIPQEDYTTYGEDFVESTRRWARAEVQEDLANMRAQLEELRNHAQQSTGDRLKDRVRAALNRDPELAGRWETMDTDPGFNAWLGDFDPFSGHRRLDMLREAYAGGDAVRTGAFFKAYLQEHTDYPRGQQAPPQTAYPVTPPSNGAGYYGNGAGRDLTAYAAPGRASNATPGPGAPERRIWTNRDIQAFYESRLKGRFKGREAEADRLERDILLAAQEGRVSQ